MKVLYIVSRSPDWFSTIIYFGLKELGVDVMEYPYNPLFHCSLEEGGIVVRDQCGTIVGRENTNEGKVYIDKSFAIVKRGATHTWIDRPNCWIQKERKSDVTSNLDNIDSYDCVISGTFRWDTISVIGNIINKVRDRFCLIDGEDDPYIRSVYLKSNTYFKRELLKKNEFFGSFYNPFGHARYVAWTYFDHSIANVIPSLRNIGMCLCVPQNRLIFRKEKLLSLSGTTIPPARGEGAGSNIEKEYDISMIQNSKSNLIRERFAAHLREFCARNKLKSYIKTDGSIPWNDYVKIIKRSKCCVSMPGFGYDTSRYWEIPCYGSVLVSPNLPIEIRNNFKDMESAVFFKTLREFEVKISRVLRDGLWTEISKEGKRLFEDYHLPVNRAETVLRTFKRI